MSLRRRVDRIGEGGSGRPSPRLVAALDDALAQLRDVLDQPPPDDDEPRSVVPSRVHRLQQEAHAWAAHVDAAGRYGVDPDHAATEAARCRREAAELRAAASDADPRTFRAEREAAMLADMFADLTRPT